MANISVHATVCNSDYRVQLPEHLFEDRTCADCLIEDMHLTRGKNAGVSRGSPSRWRRPHGESSA
jgi:hypothetical protein